MTPLGVCNMTIFDRVQYKCLHDLLLKKYRSIVLQRTFYQLFLFFRLNIVYNATYIHISVDSVVERHCTYSQSQKYIIRICFKALLVKGFIHALVWRALFLSLHPKRAR